MAAACGWSAASAQCCAKPQTAYFMPAPTTAYYAPVQTAFVQPQTVMYMPQTYYRPTLVNLPLTAYQPINNYGALLAQPAVAYRPVTYYVNQVQWSPYTSYRQVIAPMAVQAAPAAAMYAAPAYPAPGTTYAPAPTTTYAQPAPASSEPSTYATPSAPYCPPGAAPAVGSPSDASTPPSLLTPPSNPASPGAMAPPSGAPLPTYQEGAPGPTTETMRPLDSPTPSGAGDDTHSASRGRRSTVLPQRTDWSYAYERQKPIPSPLLSATVRDEPRAAEASPPANAGGWQASRR